MVVLDLEAKNRSWKMSREQSKEKDGVVETEVRPVDDDTAETEVDFRPDHSGCHWEPGDSRKSRGLTGSHLKRRPQHIRHPVGSQRVPGQGW